jgi:hypothetical protein
MHHVMYDLHVIGFTYSGWRCVVCLCFYLKSCFMGRSGRTQPFRFDALGSGETRSAVGRRLDQSRRTHNLSMFAYRSVAPKDDLQLEGEAMAASLTPSEESGAVSV